MIPLITQYHSKYPSHSRNSDHADNVQEVLRLVEKSTFGNGAANFSSVFEEVQTMVDYENEIGILILIETNMREVLEDEKIVWLDSYQDPLRVNFSFGK